MSITDTMALIKPYTDRIVALERDLAAARAELEAARKDAERYRWLRNETGSLYHYVTCWTGGKEKEAMNIDAGIDAAMRQEKP